jgi:hypothetical protein
MFSWDGITTLENSSYRFTLETSDYQYSIFQKINGDQTSLFIPDSLIGSIGYDWNLNFQERIVNPLYETTDNFNWLRSYAVQDSLPIDISLDGSTATNPVPIPGSVLLLGSGIIGLVGFKSRKK